MWIKRSAFIFIYLKIKHVHLPFVIPIRVFWEVIEALEDLLFFAGRKTGIKKAINAISDAVWMISSMGSFDLLEVEASGNVKLKVCLR